MDINLVEKTKKEVKARKFNPKYIGFIIAMGLIYLGIGAAMSVLTFKLVFIGFEYAQYGDKLHMTRVLSVYLLIVIVLQILYAGKIVNNDRRYIKKYMQFKFDAYLNNIKLLRTALTTGMALMIAAGISASFFIWAAALNIIPAPGYQGDKARNLHHTAIHESGHAIIGENEFPGKQDSIRIFSDKESIIYDLMFFTHYGLPLGASVRNETHANARYSEEYFKHIRISLAGYVAEELLTEEKEPESGSSADLDYIKKLVKILVNAGKSSLGPVQWDVITQDQQSQVYNEIVTPLYQQVKDQVIRNKDQILKVAAVVEKKKVISGEDIRKIMKQSNLKQK